MNKVLLKKYAGTHFRDNNVSVDDLLNYEPCEKEWKELREAKATIQKVCRKLVDKVQADTNERALEDIEDVTSDLLALADNISDEMDWRDANECRDARPGANQVDLSMRPNFDGVARNYCGPTESEESTLLAPEQRMSSSIDFSGSEYRGLRVGDYLRAMVRGASNDVERRALAEGADSAGGYTVPEVLSAQLIDLMRAKNVAIKAGARTIPLTSDTHHIAKVATDPVPAWRAENASINESDPTFTRVSFAPKSLAVLVKVSREIIEDSLNINEELPRILTAALAGELDRAVFLGTGTGNEPSGLDSLSGVQGLAHDAAITNYAPLVAARRQLMGVNTDSISAFVMHPDVESVFGGLTDTTGQPLSYPPILDRPQPLNMLTTTQLPVDLGTGTNESTIYCGDFTKLVIGVRSDIRIEILRERYADNHQYGFIAHMRADVQAIQPNNLLRITGVQLS